MAIMTATIAEAQAVQAMYDQQQIAWQRQVDLLNTTQASLRTELAACKGQLPTVPPVYPSGFAPQKANQASTTVPKIWKNIWFEDFVTPVAEGGFSLAYPTFNAYGKGWPDTNHNTAKAQYQGFDNISVSDNRMKVRLYTPQGSYARVAALGPNNDARLIGMRCAMAFRVVNAIGGYHLIPILTWPGDEQWPLHGEIDFTENDSRANDRLNLFTHRANAAGGVDGVPAGITMPLLGESVWHLLEFEMIPGVSATYWVDGRLIVKHTTQIPSTSHRWVMQLEGTTGSNVTGQSIVEVDWASQWSLV